MVEVVGDPAKLLAQYVDEAKNHHLMPSRCPHCNAPFIGATHRQGDPSVIAIVHEARLTARKVINGRVERKTKAHKPVITRACPVIVKRQ